MKDLIKADLRRILAKKSFWIVVGVSALLALIGVINEKSNFFNGLVYAVGRSISLSGQIPLFVGIASFLGIYADEFSAKSFQTTIGRGIPRHKIIAAKLIDCTLLEMLVFFCFWVFFVLLGLITGAKMSGAEYGLMTLSCIGAAFTVICATPLAAVVMFATDNAALSIFVELLLVTVIPLALGLLDSVPPVHNYRIKSYYITGIADSFCSDMLLYGGGVVRLLVGAAVYLGIAYILAVLVFGKKELEL